MRFRGRHDDHSIGCLAVLLAASSDSGDCGNVGLYRRCCGPQNGYLRRDIGSLYAVAYQLGRPWHLCQSLDTLGSEGQYAPCRFSGHAADAFRRRGWLILRQRERRHLEYELHQSQCLRTWYSGFRECARYAQCQCRWHTGSDDGDSGRGLPTGDTGLARYLAVAAIGYPMDNRGRDEPGTLCRLFVYRPVLLDGAWNDGGPFDARSLLPVYVGLIYMLTHEMGLSWV